MTPTELASLEALAKAARPEAHKNGADWTVAMGRFQLAATPDAILSLIEEYKRMREALEPFSVVAGELFANNFNRPDVVFEIEQPNLVRITAGDFFRARVALEPQS